MPAEGVSQFDSELYARAMWSAREKRIRERRRHVR